MCQNNSEEVSRRGPGRERLVCSLLFMGTITNSLRVIGVYEVHIPKTKGKIGNRFRDVIWKELDQAKGIVVCPWRLNRGIGSRIILSSREEIDEKRECRFVKAMMGIDQQAPEGEFGPTSFRLTYSLCFLFAFMDSLLKSGRFHNKKFLTQTVF